jgi:hypothetical protein
MAAGILKSIKRTDQNEGLFEFWLRFSRDVAVRSGDSSWLSELSKIESPFEWDKVFLVNLAYGKLAKGDLKGAEKLLGTLGMDDDPRGCEHVLQTTRRIRSR